MGGAVMFLIAVSAGLTSAGIASAGVTYGWTPDGGQGVKYIIQIPPDEVDQVVRSGEIASQIPIEIRGRVSEVVVRVGNGSVPRITPNHLAQADYSTSSQGLSSSSSSLGAPSTNPMMVQDRSPMPIPVMNGMMQLSPIRNPDAATAMMKPAPQGGGMNLPGSLGTPSATPSRSNMPMPSTSAANPQNNFGNAGRSLQQAARDSIDNAGNQLRGAATNAFQNTQSAINQTADRLGQSANSQMQAASESAARAAREAVSGLMPSDDPRTRLTQNNPAVRDSQSSTINPYSRAATSIPGTSPRDSRTSVSSASSDQAEQDWYDLRNGSTRRPSTDPIDSRLADQNRNEPSGPSLFENSNFGRMPSGLDTDRNRESSTASRSTTTGAGNNNSGLNDRYANSNNSSLDYDPRLSAAEAQRLPPGGYSFDPEGYPIDRQGYRLNRFGQRTDESQRSPSVQDQFGQDRLATRDPNRSLDNSSQFGRDNDPRYTNAATNSNGYNATTPNSGQNNGYSYNNNSLVQPPPATQPFSGTQSGTYPQTGPYQPTGQYQQAGQFPQAGQYPQVGQYPPVGQYAQAGQYPVSPTNPGMNPYTNPSTIGTTTGLAGYPSLNDPRLTSFNGQSIGSKSSMDSSDVSANGSNDTTGRTGRETLTSGSRDRYSSTLEDPDAVAAQPIFNGMLLLSVVTNVYLLFWLKNLRLQFRDTVASRRSASNNGPVVAT